MHTHTKYTPYPTVKLDKREWADKSATVAPRWVSTDLRDGNQALANPMGIVQKIAYFKALVEFGFKEIEVAYPSASQTEFDFCRRLIEEGLIPDDVTIGVLVPSIERHIIRSFEALRGAKRITMHLYNPTATNQRSVVFSRSREQIIELALQGVECIKNEADKFAGEVVFEYSPESFSQTELEFARDISNAVIEAWKPTREHPMVLNLPNTLEACSPNIYADRIEWMSKHIKNCEGVIISVHPHNDRGCAVASAELAVLAGAQRVEGTILGNGERAGNVDLITLAFNYFSQGIDPCLRADKVDEILSRITSITGMSVAERHPYVGSMIYTAFSGTHQDAIKKGMEHHREHNSPTWEVPYLAIDPRDIGREYKDSIRINSQSGKGGVAYVLKEIYGIEVPNDIQTKLADEVKRISQKRGGEISSDEVLGIYEGMMKRNENSWNAQEYNKHAAFVYNLALPVVDLLAPIEGEEILDLGCGEGTLALEIQKSGAKVTGVDLSHEMVESAKAKGIDATVMSVTELEFKNRFDAVFSNAVLHWVKESETAVKNIHDSLKPNGRFVAEFGGFGNCKTAVDAMKEVFKNHPEFGVFDDPWYFPSVEEYRALLESCCFRVEYIELIPRPTPVDDIANWLDLFANGVTAHLSREEFCVFKEEVRAIVKPALYDENDGWHVDYVRLRVKAVRGK
ncbi:2-isopropylmalate synthase [Sulfuricurvum sp.]|uniref:2-isopropylmalate synthase n=1 Tax=Sulfuricurvum sp. TaxID=2025608 RepID=UPI002D4A18C0|nr:2-isopropylmalate synthase [Sulfuricurvum sp.]HZF71434.1 2-isopropylmalate synthase [Sulfuricurvum sp.]